MSPIGSRGSRVISGRTIGLVGAILARSRAALALEIILVLLVAARLSVTAEQTDLAAERARGDAYADRPLPIGYGQTISQPFIVALMTDLVLNQCCSEAPSKSFFNSIDPTRQLVVDFAAMHGPELVPTCYT
jgi:hypothetical protein